MMRARPLARTWRSHTLARLALVCALLAQLLAPAQAAPAPLSPQAQAIIAVFGADALCLATDPGKADHGLACLACPSHCASGMALAPVATSPALCARSVAAVTPPATAPPGLTRPRSDLTAHAPPSA